MYDECRLLCICICQNNNIIIYKNLTNDFDFEVFIPDIRNKMIDTIEYVFRVRIEGAVVDGIRIEKFPIKQTIIYYINLYRIW